MKNTMKLFWLLAAASIVLSCSKEAGQNLEATPGEEKTPAVITPATDGNLLTSFGVTFEGDVQDEETKVSVNLGTGVTAMEENDEVLVFVDGENNAIYKYDGEKFVLKEGETAVALGAPASVYYPASEFAKTTADFTMPDAIEASGDFGAINPMAGVISGEPGSYSVTLGNIASVLRVHVSADVNITSVSLDFGSGVTYARGSTFSVDASTKAMTAKTASAKTTETVYLGTPGKAADVLFILPTLALSNGLTVTANLAANHNGGANSFSISKATYIPTANKISSMSFYAGLFSGGAGTSESPYFISNARDFKNIQKYTVEGYTPGSMNAASFLGAYYQQTENITAGTVTPVGTSTAPFTGNYDGQGNTLNVTISTTTDNTGVFGYIQNANVMGLTVDGTIQSSGVYTAGIAGQMAGSSKISDCTNMATISNSSNEANSYAAGIVGKALNTSEIVSCVNEGVISASKAFAAGIVGDMTGTVDKCVNKNSVTGGANTGGIAGALRASSTVRRCYSSDNKTITGTNRVGGIIGSQVGGTVANCFSNSNVTITSNTADYGAGGLVGVLGGGLLFNSATGGDIIVKCSVSCTKATDAKVNVGGLVGRQSGGTIQNVYSPLFAKDIKIGSIHGRSGSGKIGQIVGVVTTDGSLCAYYFGGCATATTGWQYWGTNDGQSSSNYEGQWAFTSTNTVSMDWTAPVAKDFSGFGQSLNSGNYHLKDVLNIDKSTGTKYSAYTPAEGEVITWSDLSASDFHAIPDALKVLGEDYYAN